MKNLAILALLATLGGCAANGNAADPAAANSSRATAEDQIAEAVFRYLFEHNASGMQKDAEKYCLSLPGEKMPGVAFLQRFKGNKPPVLAADQCDRKSGKNLFFRVQKVDWRKDGEVWVRGGYYEGNLSSSIELFQVVNENGKWVVKGARMEAIS
jgi:hypothetical protein